MILQIITVLILITPIILTLSFLHTLNQELNNKHIK